MTIEEAWLMWMKQARSTTEPPTIEDFEIIKKSSHWVAFEAGWNAACCNGDSEVVYKMGLEAGKEIKKHWVGFTHEELAWINEALNLGGRLAVVEAIEAKLKEKNK